MLNWLRYFNYYRDTGLLLFRLGLGGMFMWHGFPKVFGGAAKWSELGTAMSALGIHFAPAFWGLASGCTEFFGGLLFVLGLFYRPVCIFLIINMTLAAAIQLINGAGMMKAAQAVEDGVTFLGSLFIGPGKYSLDEHIGLNRQPGQRDFINRLS